MALSLESLGARITTLEADNISNKARLTALEGRALALESSCTALTTQITDFKKRLGLTPAIVTIPQAQQDQATAAGFDPIIYEKVMYRINEKLGTTIDPASVTFITYDQLVAGPAPGNYIVIVGPLEFTEEKQIAIFPAVPLDSYFIALSATPKPFDIGYTPGGVPNNTPRLAGTVVSPTWVLQGPSGLVLADGIYVRPSNPGDVTTVKFCLCLRV